MNRTELPEHMWRKRLGKVQLRCPHCDKFFYIPPDVKVRDNGDLTDVIYHFCDNETNSWVVLARLMEWKNETQD